LEAIKECRNKCINKILTFLQCREIGYEIHEEVLKVLHELHTAIKTQGSREQNSSELYKNKFEILAERVG
jgi:hypothetical protein